jgi:protein-L-isoaspartate(D-aspartate) O-methyltransferase
VAAAANQPPQSLLEQLKPGGRLVLPLGPREAQRLTVIEKSAAGEITRQEFLAVLFSELETV